MPHAPVSPVTPVWRGHACGELTRVCRCTKLRAQHANLTAELSSESEAVLSLTNELRSAHGVMEELHAKMKAVPDDILQVAWHVVGHGTPCHLRAVTVRWWCASTRSEGRAEFYGCVWACTALLV